MTRLLRRTKSLTPAEAADAFRRGTLQLVDVRGADELANARVEGARHIPLGELDGRLDELERARPVAFLCQSGKRSAMAALTAMAAGLDAASVKGGVVAWKEAGFALESGSTGADA